MKKLIIGLAAFLGACSNASVEPQTATTVMTPVTSPSNQIVKISEKVAGKHLHQYANTWWQWTNTMNNENSPVIDRNGSKCHVNQHGDVWFLAGGYGTSKITRSCTIPEGKHIFFPVINMAYWPKQGAKLSCDRVKKSAALNNDHLLDINVELDGRLIPQAGEFRIKSEQCFDLLALIPEQYNAPKVFPAATDGYWLMLKPLAKGKHTLKFNAQYNRVSGAYGQMAQDIEYELEVL